MVGRPSGAEGSLFTIVCPSTIFTGKHGCVFVKPGIFSSFNFCKASIATGNFTVDAG